MTKRLQVLLDDEEYAEIAKLARGQRRTTAAWVRDALRSARSIAEYPLAEAKLRAVREAAAHAFPTGPIEAMLEEAERGYLSHGQPDEDLAGS